MNTGMLDRLDARWGQKRKWINPMRHKHGYLVGGLGVAVAMLSFVVTLEAEVAPPAGPRFDPAAVNRSLKGNRLPLMPATTGANPIGEPRKMESQAPRTCPAVHDMFAPEVAGRCLA
jgi:hypothetical protein